ncbi:MAG: hypothetical protein EU981_03620 [Candidatus Liberibacter ctenarytainae]|uniref:ATP synthase F(0) sector subunit b 2 n=1 Tax=Candidatus Liberibacter ctenarytainae TaxID=2020335 RepID=A0A937ACD5_9HYPH|nr:hypothetical protein [Candidatus Liberibacter ctenarytainae]
MAHKFPPFDTSTFLSQFCWLVVIFGIFYWVMHRFILPRLDAIMTLRRNRVSNDWKEMNSLKHEMDCMVSSCDKDLALARTKAKEMINRATIYSSEKMESERKKTEIYFSNQFSDAQQKIYNMQEQELKKIPSVSERILKDLVQKMIGISISDDHVRSVVRKFHREES